MKTTKLTVPVIVVLLFTSVSVVTLSRMRAPVSPTVAIRNMEIRVGQKRRVSKPELENLKQLSNNKDYFVRSRAVTALSYLKDVEGKQFAIAVAKSHLGDSEWLVRHAALNALRRVESPGLRSIASRMLNDSSPEVRKAAQRIVSL